MKSNKNIFKSLVVAAMTATTVVISSPLSASAHTPAATQAFPSGSNCYRGDRKFMWKDPNGSGWHHIIEFDVNRSGNYYLKSKPSTVWSANLWPGYYNGYHKWVGYNAVSSPWTVPDYIYNPADFYICL